jgi:hypothetical protein
MISFGIFALFLISTISALPAPGGHVLSAVIQNKQNIPIRCTINWEGPNGPLNVKDVITIDSNQAKTVNERDVSMGAWTAFAYIKQIQCGNLVLFHPFQGVPSIEKFWNFAVESNNILSVGPKSE